MLQKLALASALIVLTAMPALAADPAAGEKVFNKCKACHEVAKPQNKVGPHLVGIIGRQAGSVENFKYSDAMKNANIAWTEENLTAYMKDPKDFVKGNKMAFAGLKKDEEIADLLAYLQQAAGSS